MDFSHPTALNGRAGDLKIINVVIYFQNNFELIYLTSSYKLKILKNIYYLIEEKTWDFFNYSFAKELKKAGIKDRLKYMEKLLAARTKSAARAKKEKTE
jgi:hypothetical protein